MSEYRPHIGRPDGPAPFLICPPFPGGPWTLVFCTFTGPRPTEFEIDGQLSEAEAIIAAQEYVMQYGRLIVEAEVHAEPQSQNTTPVLSMMCIVGTLTDHDWHMRDGTLCCRLCDGTATQFGK